MTASPSRRAAGPASTPESREAKRRAVNAIFVDRKPMAAIAGRMDKLRRNHREGAETKCLALVGEPGVGKSAFLKNYAAGAAVAPIVDEEGIRNVKPVIYVKTPSDATVNSCSDAMLSVLLGRKVTTNGRSKDGELETQLELYETELVILDDFQHAAERGREKTRSRTADFIKAMTKQTGIPLVLAGMPELKDLIVGNKQLRTICPWRFAIPSYEDSVKGLRRFLSDFDALLPFDVPSELADEERSAAIHMATGGLLRSVGHLLLEAADHAIDADAPFIRDRDLFDAFDTGGHDWNCSANPFRSLAGR